MKAIYSDLGMSVKMRLYSLQKRHILVVFLCFFAFLFLSLTIGLFGPRMLRTITVKATNLTSLSNLKTGPFVLETPYLGKFHQQLWITAQPVIEGRKEEFSKQFILNIHLHSTNDDFEDFKNYAETGTTPSSLSDKKSQQLHAEYFNRTRYLHCINEVCDTFSILHLDYLHTQQYTVEIKLFNLEEATTVEIKNYIFTFNSYNPAFTKLELWYRFIFLSITFIVLIVYTRSLNKFSLRDWSIEQKWMFILLRSLLFFNNPLFPLNLLLDSWMPHILDAIFQSTFLAMIMVFWLSIYHGVRQNDRNFLTFYVPKFVIVFTIWLLSICLLLWQQYTSLSDPTYNLALDESSYMIFRILFLVFFVLYLLFLLYLIVRAIAELKNMPYFDVRIKFSIALMLIVIVTLSFIGFLRMHSDPFRQSLYENFTKNYRNSVEFCAIFALFNIYIYTLAFVYSPAKNASIDNEYGDNPTFSMLNDTDEEDVVYGIDNMKSPAK